MTPQATRSAYLRQFRQAVRLAIADRTFADALGVVENPDLPRPGNERGGWTVAEARSVWRVLQAVANAVRREAAT